MTKRLLTAAFLLASAMPAFVASPATAQQRNCGDREAIVERLAERYGEARTGAGLTAQNGMVEVFTSEESGSWTILITMPTGVACLVAAGESWEGDLTPEVTKSGAPV